MNSDKVVTATFSAKPPVTYTLTVNTAGDGGGAVSLNPPGSVYAAGTVVTLTATAGLTASFGGWRGAVTSADNPTTVTMDSDKVVTATFSTKPPVTYTLTLTIIGRGSVLPPARTFISGTVFSLTATPDTGWQFDSWSGALSGSDNPADLTMDRDKVVTATFTETVISDGHTICLPLIFK
jgi:hypothetical protein